MKTISLFVPALVLVLVSCGVGPDPSADEPRGAPTGSWQLVEGHGPGGAVPVLADHGITLRFAEDGTEISGTAACNQYFGEVTIEGDTITVDGIGQTEMACSPQRVMEAERTYLEALVGVTSLERSGNRLMLAGPDTQLTYERLAPADG